jgi:hypothetical protein
MIICDEQHDETTVGLPALQLRGTTAVDGAEVRFDLRVQVPGKHYCQEHFVKNILSKIDFVKLASDASPAPAKD